MKVTTSLFFKLGNILELSMTTQLSTSIMLELPVSSLLMSICSHAGSKQLAVKFNSLLVALALQTMGKYGFMLRRILQEFAHGLKLR